MTVLGAISTKSLALSYIMAESTCGQSFIKLIEHISKNENLRTTILVCDNHKAHYNKEAKAMMSELGLEVCFMPPSSSPLNPIEQVWSVFKHRIRRSFLAPGGQSCSDSELVELCDFILTRIG